MNILTLIKQCSKLKVSVLNAQHFHIAARYTAFDELIYKTRFVIERPNAWLDALKAIMVRFETNNLHLKGLMFLSISDYITEILNNFT